MLKLIVFDCDGVMFDSREANRRYYNDLLTAFSHPAMDEEELSFVHMHNVTDSVNHIFRHYPREQLEEVHRYRLRLDYRPYLSSMIMEADLIDFLEFARNSYKLAISTNRTTTMRPLLQAFRLEGYFDKVVTAGDVARPKPAPDALLDILTHFGCSAGQAIYIGDSLVDRQHTEAVGVPLIAFKNPALPAEYHVDSFNQIRQLALFKR
ncbi:MAG: HAD family hydrolase [Desulfofustis sp.]|nr:HAD family hydrolase [Desulfofustis sp.]